MGRIRFLARRACRIGATGATAVEFALVSPILLALVAGVVDVSRCLWYQSETMQAARSGLQYAIASPGDRTGTANVMLASTPLGGDPRFSVDASQCACSASASTTLAWSPCAALTCSAQPVHRYVKITASYQWQPIFGMASLLPGTVGSTIAVRVQ